MPPKSRRIRPLTEAELEALEKALGAPVDREHLNYWLSEAIEDAVRSASYPPPRQLRDGLLEIERNGRQLLSSMDEPKVAAFIGARANFGEFRAATAQFCDQIGALAREVDALVRPGRSRTPAALEGFIDRVIGIAKKAMVLPSTPSRREERQTAETTVFFGFLNKALGIARRVIKSSQLPDDLKAAADSKLKYRTREALIELVVKVRGQVGNYREAQDGLVEWSETEPDPG
jgi:hypothetical protein